jgi:hypothetical protein
MYAWRRANMLASSSALLVLHHGDFHQSAFFAMTFVKANVGKPLRMSLLTTVAVLALLPQLTP